MRTIEVNLYKFDELSKEAKDNLIAGVKRGFDYGESLSMVLEEWEEKLKTMGFVKPRIEYSGFGSQGDGASFVSEDISNVPEIAALITPLETSDIDIKIVRTERRYCHEYTVRVEAYSGVVVDEVLFKIEREADKIITRICREIYKELEKEFDYVTSDEYIESYIREQNVEYFEDGRIYY